MLLPHNVADGEFLPGKGKVLVRSVIFRVGQVEGRGLVNYCSLVFAFA